MAMMNYTEEEWKIYNELKAKAKKQAEPESKQE